MAQKLLALTPHTYTCSGMSQTVFTIFYVTLHAPVLFCFTDAGAVEHLAADDSRRISSRAAGLQLPRSQRPQIRRPQPQATQVCNCQL